MYPANVFQPDNLSAAEWKLLQLLATYTDSFSVESVLVQQHNETLTEGETLTFYRHFYRLKNCSYIEVLPSVENEADNNEHMYKLSPVGLKATLPKEKPVYPMKSLLARKPHSPKSFYLK